MPILLDNSYIYFTQNQTISFIQWNVVAEEGSWYWYVSQELKKVSSWYVSTFTGKESFSALISNVQNGPLLILVATTKQNQAH